jgi:serine/threonine-protein kinase
MRRTLHALMIGTSIGQYRIVELLGSGSMGVVYKALDETLDREVAIKILNPELTGPDLIRRFRTEAAALAKLNHPEIATIYELRSSDQNFVMVMELVRGESLDKVLESSGPLPPETVAYVVDRILSALGHAHQAGIVHRDVKPANVMLTASGGVKVMDFGVAFMRGANTSGVGGGLLGTPGYMPPEQIRGHGIDGRSDLYAVGVIFYRLLTGAFPFKANTIEEMLRKQLSNLPTTPLNHYRAGLPVWCEQILERALATSPSRRFQTAAEFRLALKQATRSVPERTAKLSVSELGRLGVERAKVPPAISPELKGAAPHKTVTLNKTAVLRKTIVFSSTPAAWKVAALTIAAMVIVAVAYFAPWRVAPGRLSRPSVPVVPSTPRRFEPSALQPVVKSKPPVPAVVMPPLQPAKAAGKRGIHAEPPAATNLSASALNASPVNVPAPNALPANAPQAAEVTPSVFPPLVFDAKALVGIVDRQTEREVNIQLADGYLAVTVAGSPNEALYRQPFKGIGSIAYSLSRHPLWLSPNGPAEAARAGRVLGIFSRSRHWVTLRSGDAADPSAIVLRFENGDQVGSVVRALAERTGRTAVRVLEPK